MTTNVVPRGAVARTISVVLLLPALQLLFVTTATAARPGDYSDYYFEQSGIPATFYNYDQYVTWETAPASGSIYPAFNFSFVTGSGGYMGTQLVGSTKKAIFSIWDSADNSGTAVPIGNCNRFSGEGTGAQCLIDYAWQQGVEYRLRIWALQSTGTGEQWVGAIANTATGVETQIGVIELKNTGGQTGYGWLDHHSSIFLEYFGGADSCEGQPYAKIKWRGPYANAGSYAPSRAIVPSWVNYGCSTHNNVTSPSQPIIRHEGGGTGTPITNPPGTTLWPTGCG